MTERQGDQMNKLDELIEKRAFEYFTKLGMKSDLIAFSIKELKICTERGYNSRSEILNLLKVAAK